MVLKKLLFFAVILLSFNTSAQILFEKAYYIDDSGQKTNCFIKNMDWKNNPTEFEYRASESDVSKKASMQSVKEFGIYNVSKYIRKAVNIDRSSKNINRLSHEKKATFTEEVLFLKVLVEGKSNLYEYVDGNLRRFFYDKENANIEQLIFKHYINKEKKVGKNNRFRQQLWTDLNCSNTKTSSVKNINYTKNDLVRFFTAYSACLNSESITFEIKKKRDLFNLTIRPRFNHSSLNIKNTASSVRNTDFGSQSNFGIGLEAEFILPFNKNKWAFVIEPTYQKFNTEKTRVLDNAFNETLTTKVAYSSIEIPLSIRHYFFLNGTSKIFINATFILDLSSNSSINFKRADNSILSTLDIETRNNLAFGIGVKLYDKYSLEMRIQTNRELLGNYISWNGTYKTASIIVGYSLF
ncbi:MAG: tRNA modification GTPase [Flavobacteriaceae bacterium]|nr:MAG: tRNA modification GTPase [Flavobacteriaceae bacterium]